MGSANRNNQFIMSFIDQLKRRNVFRVGIAYLIVAWLIAQVTELALDSFATPDWVMKTVLFLLVIGFPLALFLAWAFELTPDGVRLEKDVVRSESITRLTGRKFDFAIIGLLLLAIAFLIVDNYVLDDATDRFAETAAERRLEPASLEKMAFPLPDKPSIVVLPFDNMSGDEEQEYFVDGITEDLTTDLSKLGGLFVIARNSAFTYKGRAVSARQVAEELGVQYIVEGSVRRVGDRIRINAQFIDALSGHHVWAERYDGSLTDVFALQDRVVKQIISALAVNLPSAELAMTLIGGTDNSEAYMAALRGWDHYRRQTSEDSIKAVAFFEKAVELDPGYSRAYAGLGRAYWDISNMWWSAGTPWQVTVNLAKSNLAMALREPTADAFALSAEINVRMGRQGLALNDIDRAIALGPSVADNTIVKAGILNAVGRAEEAEQLARQAMRLDPHFKPAYARVLGHSLLHQERYAEAVNYLEMAASEGKNPFDFVSLAVAYGYLERLKDASAAIDNYHKLNLELNYSTPLTVQESDKWWYGDMFDYDKTYKGRLLEGLRKAGVPEGPAQSQEDSDYRLLMSRDTEILSVKGVATIDADTAKQLWEGGATFVDVRDKLAFDAGRVPGAIHLDLHVDFNEERLSELVDRNEKVVLSCWGENCPYAAHACAMAVTWGYTQVSYFAEGFQAWSAAGYPVEELQD